MLNKKYFVFGAAAALTLLAGCSGPAEQEQGPPAGGSSASESPEPAPMPELDAQDLQQRWWEWAASVPAGANPVEDKSGQYCAKNQPEGLWFLADSPGGSVERSCEVPATARVAFPVVNFQADSAQACTARMQGAVGQVLLDSEEIETEKLEPVQISYSGVAGNAVTETAGETRKWACGLWVQVPPLDAGEHNLTFFGRNGDSSFEVGVDYTLTVA